MHDLTVPGWALLLVCWVGSGLTTSLGSGSPDYLSSLNNQQILLPNFSINVMSSRHLASSGRDLELLYADLGTRQAGFFAQRHKQDQHVWDVQTTLKI